MQFPILSIIILMPLLGMLCVMATSPSKPQQARIIASVVMGIDMLLSIWVYYCFYSLDHAAQAGFNFIERAPFFPQIAGPDAPAGAGINYILGVDGINAPMLLLTGILGFAVALVSFSIKERVKEYYALALASIAGVFGIFLSLDMFFFILFYEMASVPMYFLVGMWGTVPKTGHRRVTLDYAATKLIIYLQAGGALAFLGILGLYFSVNIAGPHGTYHTFDIMQIYAAVQNNPSAAIPLAVQQWLFPLIFIGFAVEAGFFPFHTWLPDGHSSAPTALSMLLAGVLLKMGGYGIIRLGMSTMPTAAHTWMPWLMPLAVINVLYGALCALRQSDIKYLIAYSSVSHMGIVILGLGSFNAFGYQGAMYQMFSHGIITALLFALAGYIYEKTHTRNIDEMGGLAIKMPFLAAVFALGGLASLGLPGLSGFVAELMVFFGLFMQAPVLAVLSILGLVITATYILRMMQKIFLGPLNPNIHHLQDAVGVEPYPLVLLALTSLIFGFFPVLLTNVMGPAVSTLLKLYGGAS